MKTPPAPTDSHSTRPPPPGTIHGVVAEFATLAHLISAIEKARKKGYRKMDAYTPFPSHDVLHALHLPSSPLPWIVLAGGLLGLCGGYFMQSFSSIVDWPVNIGGRPLHSWPYFIPITFECTILGASLSAVFGMFALNRLPTFYHPVFNYSRFASASRDGFFLCIEANDPKFDSEEVTNFFHEVEARDVAEVEA